MKCLPLAACLVLGLWAPSASADDVDPAISKLIETKANTLVSVRFVLQVTMERRGEQTERDVNGSSLGVMVDRSGLVMLPSQALTARPRVPGRGRGRGRGGRGGRAPTVIDSVPNNIRVSFPGDAKEYAAIVGAKDSKTGLAFVQITNLSDLKPAAVDLTKIATPKVGQTLYGVSRLGQSFDHAPVCAPVLITGQVAKPQPMWVLDSRNRFVGMPLYTKDGAVAGVCALQSGVGENENAQARPFLLPIERVHKVIVRAKVEAAKALAKSQAETSKEEAPTDEAPAVEGE